VACGDPQIPHLAFRRVALAAPYIVPPGLQAALLEVQLPPARVPDPQGSVAGVCAHAPTSLRWALRQCLAADYPAPVSRRTGRRALRLHLPLLLTLSARPMMGRPQPSRTQTCVT